MADRSQLGVGLRRVGGRQSARDRQGHPPPWAVATTVMATSSGHAHVRAFLHSLLGRQLDKKEYMDAENALLAQLDRMRDGDDDDACMALHEVLRGHMQRIRPISEAELDAAALTLMLQHRDDTMRTSTVIRSTPSSTPSSPYTPPTDARHANELRPPQPIKVSAPDAFPDEEEDEFSPFAPPSASVLYQGAASAPPLSVPDMSTLSLHAEASAPMLTPLEVFCSVFVAHNQGLFSDEPDAPHRFQRASLMIQHALDISHYDISAALQIVKQAHDAGVDIMDMQPPDSSGSDDPTTRVCRFFLAGECRRSDCRFSHDLNKALCRFWLRGQCLNDPCLFMHDYEALSMLAQSIVVAPAPPEPEPEPSWIPPRPKPDASQTPWAMAAKSAPASTAPQVMPRASASTVSSKRLALRPPSLLPTLSTGSALAIDMGKVRASQPKNQDHWKTIEALLHARHERLRERLQVGAGGDAGGWGSSAQASQERGSRGLRGRWMGAGLGLCLGVAKPQVAGASLSLDERTEAVLDLHGLHVDEALEACEQFLLALESEGFRGLAYLCVGAGKHSIRSRGKLASSVREFLQSWGYPHADYDGVLACDPCTHLS